MKISFDRQECRWLEWIESLRKDVECTFETLKGRWRILKLGTRPRGTKNADAAFKTCCAMRSWLLEVDGLDEEWEQGVPSIMWQGESGNFEDDDMASEQARASHRLRTGSSTRNCNVSGMGLGNDILFVNNDAPPHLEMDEPAVGSSNVRVVRGLNQSCLRRKLIQRFDILWQRNKIQWPKQRGIPCPSQSARAFGAT